MDLSDAMVMEVLQSVGSNYDANCVLLTLDSEYITCAAIWGRPFEYGESHAKDIPRFFRTIRRPLPIIINDVAKDPELLQGIFMDPAVRCYMSAPVCICGTYVGSIVMTCSEPQQLTIRHMDHLQMAARRMVGVLKARLYS